MRRRDDPTPPAVSFPSPFPSRTAPSHSERRTRACGEGPKRGEKGATRVENGGRVREEVSEWRANVMDERLDQDMRKDDEEPRAARE